MRIKELLEGLDEQALIAPRSETPKRAKVVGKASEELQRLYSLYQAKTRQAEQLALDHSHCDDEAQRDEINKQGVDVSCEAQILRQLFFFELGAMTNPKDGNTVGVNRDWEVWQAEECNCIFCRMNRLNHIFEDCAKSEEAAGCREDMFGLG